MRVSHEMQMRQRKKNGIRLNKLTNTRKPVKNRPKSATALPELSMKSSGFAHRAQIQFGTGAMTYVATTINGRKLCQRAEERMTRRKPMART